MSLFKVRDFWTFELNQLEEQFISEDESKVEQQQQHDATTRRQTRDQDVTGEAKFVVSLGRFHSIGHHDVFVCGNLNGFICLIQVPQNECQKYTLSKEQQQQQESDTNNNSNNTDNKSQISSGSSGANVGLESTNSRKQSSHDVNNIKDRQLLLAQQLPFPIIDLKCGFFTSALKQSIAVLSFDKLIVYQVKHNQIDLLSIEDGQTNIFSHVLEEHHRVNVLSSEIGANLVVLDRHSEEKLSLKMSSKQPTSRSLSDHKNIENHSPSIQQLHLPLRDTIIVQYTNQFVFTVVDHKKIVGHFSIYKSCLDIKIGDMETANKESTKYAADHNDDDYDYDEAREVNKNEELSKFVGFQPMTFHKSPKLSDLSIVLSLSDYTIHSIPLAKLVSEAKKNVMRRVAQNLLHDKSRKESGSGSTSVVNLVSSLCPRHGDSLNRASDQVVVIINLDLNSIEQWQFQLVNEPIQMQNIQRQASNEINLENSSQILVMSRYNLDLISSSGQHVWSQRFEAPLICIYSYTITNKSTRERDGSTKEKADKLTSRDTACEKLLNFVCTDCLSSEKCNLLILEEDKIVWSALLNVIPTQIWRSRLASKIFSSIATLDVKNCQLNVSYLGTNLDLSGDSHEEELEKFSEQLVADLNNQFDDNNDMSFNSELGKFSDGELGGEFEKRKLRVDVRLEASDQWPNVKVESKILIKPQSGNTFGLLQNMVAILEFDDLLEYSPISHQNEFAKLNESAIQLQLGNCWPDRREPLIIVGSFSLKSSSKFDPNKAESVDGFKQINHANSMMIPGKLNNILPKSLKVNMYLRFNETHSSCSFQEESFLLPLNMVAKLFHIDYSSGQNQSLEDVQENLTSYKRESYYLCDLFVRSRKDMIEVIEEVIESDLICRGLNSESPDLQLKGDYGRKFSTIESINLLAQSLDCRLKFKSDLHPPSNIDNLNESGQEYISSPVVMISIAFELFNNGQLMADSSFTDEPGKCPIVWLHLTDLGETELVLPKELIQQHAKKWKTFKTVPLEAALNNERSTPQGRPILASIESDFASPILFLQYHLIERLKGRTLQPSNSFHFMPMLKTNCNSIQANYFNLLSESNFIAISLKLHDYLKSFLEDYEKNFKVRFEKLRSELPETYYKFNLSSFTSLNLAKRLSDLPEPMRKQFNVLSALTKQHHQNLLIILTELEKFNRLDYYYSKIPKAYDLFIESSVDQLITWPDFMQLID